MSAKAVCRLGVFAYHDVVTANGNGLRRLINAIQLRVNTGEADGGEVEAAAVEMPEDSLPKLLIGGKQKQRSRVALGHTVASVFPMRPSFSVGITEEEAKGLPVQLISQPSLQRTEQPSAEALPRQSVQLHQRRSRCAPPDKRTHSGGRGTRCRISCSLCSAHRRHCSESCCGCVRFCEADDGVASSSAPLRRTGV